MLAIRRGGPQEIRALQGRMVGISPHSPLPPLGRKRIRPRSVNPRDLSACSWTGAAINNHMPRKEKIQQMFDSIAPGYDAFNHLTSLGADRAWRRRALREVVGPRVLDEACGTGDFAIAIAKHLGDLDRKGLNTGKVPDFQGGPGQKKAENCAGPRFSRGTWTEKGQKLCRSQVFGGDLDRKRPKSGKVHYRI